MWNGDNDARAWPYHQLAARDIHPPQELEFCQWTRLYFPALLDHFWTAGSAVFGLKQVGPALPRGQRLLLVYAQVKDTEDTGSVQSTHVVDVQVSLGAHLTLSFVA